MTIAIEMKLLIFYICVILCIPSYSAMSKMLQESSVAKIHEQWMSQYERSYANDMEKEKRLKIFKENLEYIEQFNNNVDNSYELGLNQFSDLTTEEFLALYTSLNIGGNISRQTSFSSKVVPLQIDNSMPTHIDWRQKGAVTNVKAQGGCAACWAFSAIGAMEGLIKIKTGKLVSLSAQQLVDCTSGGCAGGLIQDSFKYTIQKKGLTDETSYPYKDGRGTCLQDKKPSGQIKNFIQVPPKDEQQLLCAVSKQPVAASISATKDFAYYKQGIFKGPCNANERSLNHAITIVGYGTTEGTKYWLVKNSWSEKWGESGYMRLQRGVEDKRGLCGIAIDTAYPI